MLTPRRTSGRATDPVEAAAVLEAADEVRLAVAVAVLLYEAVE